MKIPSKLSRFLGNEKARVQLLSAIVVALLTLTAITGFFVALPKQTNMQQYAEEQGTTVEQLTANWTADDWWHWYKYEGNPIWGSTNITDEMLATDWVHLSNVGNLTWGANYDVQAKYNITSGMLDWIGKSNNFSAFNLKSTASYIIWKDGSTIYATNGTSGTIDYSGTDAATVIQNAVYNTPTYGKVVITEGTYTLTNAIELKSYMTFELNGELYIADAVTSNLASDASAGNNYVVVSDASLFSVGQWVALYDNTKTEDHGLYEGDGGRITNIDTGTNTITLEGNLNNNYAVSDGVYLSTAHSAIIIDSKSDIVITGRGCIDGNKANQSYIHPLPLQGTSMYTTWSGEHLLMLCGVGVYNSNNIVISGIEVKNVILHGISLLHDEYTRIEGNRVHDAYHKNIVLVGTSNSWVIKNIVHSSSMEDGIILYAGNNNDVVSQNIIYSNARYGLFFRANDIVSYGNIISDNGMQDLIITDATNVTSESDIIPSSTTTHTVSVVTKSQDITVSNLEVNGNTNSNEALAIVGSDRVTIMGGRFQGSSEGVAIASTTGIYSHDVVLEGAIIKDNAKGLRLDSDTGGSDIVVSNCIFSNNAATIDKTNAPDAVLKNCIGYTTENSGTAIFSGNGSTTSFSISHGLATTPSIVLITPTNSSMASATWWVSAKSSTTFTITFSTAPSNGDKLSFTWYAEV